MTKRNPIARFIKERNAALASLDLDRVIAHQRKWNPTQPLPELHVVEIGMHKAITGVKTFAYDFRLRSKAWLNERGYKDFMDGH